MSILVPLSGIGGVDVFVNPEEIAAIELSEIFTTEIYSTVILRSGGKVVVKGAPYYVIAEMELFVHKVLHRKDGQNA